MLNPRLLAKANEWRNEEVPKPRDNSSSQKDLTQILERDSEGKPKLDLTPIEKTTVYTPTQEDYWDLMRVYECGGWKWSVGRSLPTQKNFWSEYKEKTCIGAGVGYFKGGVYNEGRFMYGDREFFLEEGWDVLSSQEFYDKQRSISEMLQEINEWFDRK